MSTGFFVITAALPWLDTPRIERAWDAYWSVGVTRRLASASLVALLLVGAVPARSQTDAPAFGQRALEFAKTAWRHLDQKTNWIGEKLDRQEEWIRNTALSYKAFQQARSSFSRLSGGNVSLSFLQMIPSMDVGSTFAGGEEHVRIRPVFRAQDKVPKMNLPTLSTDWKSINWGQLDFDIDRNVVASSNEDKGKDPRQIEQESRERGWHSWRLTQKSRGISEKNQAILGDGPAYGSLSQEEKTHLQKRAATLRNVGLKALQKYGEDSPQYTFALSNYQKALEASKKSNQSAETIEKLRALDAEAEVEIAAYAVHDRAMRLSALRADAARENIAEASKKYDDAGKGSSIISWLALSPLLDTLKQIGKPPGPNTEDAPPRQALGQSIKQVALADMQALDQSEALKLQSVKAMGEAQQRLDDLAEKKRKIESEIAMERSGENLRDQVALLKMDIDESMTVLATQAFAAQLPPGISPIVPDGLRAQVPGSIPASKGAAAIAENMKNGFAVAGKTSSDNVEKVLRDAPGTISLGVLSPVFTGLNKGFKAVTGRAFDLTKLRESKRKMF